MRNDFASVASTADTSTDMDISFVNVPNNIPGDNIDTNIPALEVKVSPKHDVIGLASALKTIQACVNIKARDLPEDDDHRAPIDIIVALDVSGSMQGSKLDLCKKTLMLLLRVLYPEDRFGLVCYSENAFIEVPVQKMNEDNKAKCVEKIKALHTRGMTNISAAVGLAYQEMQLIETPNEVQTVFLLTDGHANTGITDVDGLLEFTRNCFAHDSLKLESTGAEEQARRAPWNLFQRQNNTPKTITIDPKKAKRSNPITLHCFGYGSSHNSALLQGMSNVVPGGTYYFVENDANVTSAFADALGGIMSVVAQNVVVTISVPEESKECGVEIVQVHHENQVKRENGSYTIVVGDFYAEESRDVLFEVKLAQSDGNPQPIPHAHVSVSYTDTLQRAPANADPASCYISRPEGPEVSTANPHVDVQLTRMLALKAMKEANELAMANDFDGATTRLTTAKSSIRATSAGGSAVARATLDSLNDDITTLEGGLSSASIYRSHGGHQFRTQIASHGQQRAMDTSLQGAAPGGFGGTYKTTMKSAMNKKFANTK